MGHDPAQAAGLPGSLREFRSGRRCRFRRRRCGRLLNDPSIVRNRAKILATLDNARAAVALRRESDTGGLAGLVWSHRPSRTPEAASRRRYPHSLGGIDRISPGSQTAWLPIRGADNLLLPHGGHRHYRHPSGRLPPPRLLGSVVLRAIDVQMGSRLPPVPSAHGVIGARCGRRSAGNRQDRRRPTGRPRDESRLPPHRHGRGRDLA